MENQTRFDLTAALARWRAELAAQPALSDADRRELETHLLDTLAEYRRRPLSDEESFLLARARVGPAPQLADEFQKAHPETIWRERLFWMSLSLAATYVFMTWKDLFATFIPDQAYAWSELFYAIPVSVMLGGVVLIRRGRVPGWPQADSRTYWKTGWFLASMIVLTVASAVYRFRHMSNSGNGLGGLLVMGANIELVSSWVGNAILPALTVCALLLTHKRAAKTSRRVIAATP